jgi:Protein of unknown function (DUF3892)
MAQDLEIKCINKSDRFNPHERILKIGSLNADGSRWKLEQQSAIQGMKNGKWIFHVTKAGKNVRVIIAKSPYGHEYLKTEADGELPNNLLSLPECP